MSLFSVFGAKRIRERLPHMRAQTTRGRISQMLTLSEEDRLNSISSDWRLDASIPMER